MGRAWVIVVALVSGCVSTDTTLCDDGQRCPDGTECVAITFTDAKVETTCVAPDQREVCAGRDDGMDCRIGLAMAKGTCHEHVCFPIECGNRLVDGGEACDDGNAAAGDGCSATCMSNETCGNREVDVVTGENCDDGGALSHDGCSSRCTSESQTWARLKNARPPASAQMGLTYDVARRRVVMFGGGNGLMQLGETYEWDGMRWSRGTVLPEPLPRMGHGMAYDAARGESVMFGGDTAGEMWLRDRTGAWTLRTLQHRPPFVTGAAMAYDAGRKRVVMHGGYGQEEFDTTWFWDGTAWTELTTGPRPVHRFQASMAYDPKRGVIVMFGGADFEGNVYDEVWELDGDTWALRTPVSAPTARCQATMAWDPISERVVMVGGRINGVANTETWAWDGQVWTRLANAHASAPDEGLALHAMTTDTARGRMVIVGTQGDVQEWDGTQWTIVDLRVDPEPQMSERYLHAAALDPLRREVVVFGGRNTTPQLGDTWIWNGVWRQAVVTPSPSPRRGASLVFDVARREMVLFGGCLTVGALAETWVWKDGRWTERFPVTSPPPRCNQASAYDPRSGQVVLFGGDVGGPAVPFKDTWSWNGTTWTESLPLVHPTERTGASMAYDPVHAQLVMFGGNHGASLPDTWTWDGQTWTDVTTTAAPSGRSFSGLAWDAARKRLVVFAGNSGNVSTSASADVWEWNGTDWALRPTARPPIARSQHALVPDLDGSGVLVIGGYQVSPPAALGDMWRLAWEDRGVNELCTEVDTDGDGRIGLADPDCWSTLTPLCPPGTSCDPMAPRCGDGTCNVELERCDACPSDCGACADGCGNFACDGGETIASCPGDCGA